VSLNLRFIIKSRFKSRAGYNGMCEIFINPIVNYFHVSSSNVQYLVPFLFLWQEGAVANLLTYLRLSKKIPFKLSEIQYLDEYSMNTCLSVRRGKAVGLFISKFEMNAYHISDVFAIRLQSFLELPTPYKVCRYIEVSKSIWEYTILSPRAFSERKPQWSEIRNSILKLYEKTKTNIVLWY
jgi:hypothetical protein